MLGEEKQIKGLLVRFERENGDTSNFAILVPTKALINEVKRKVIKELKGVCWGKRSRLKAYQFVSKAYLPIDSRKHFQNLQCRFYALRQ